MHHSRGSNPPAPLGPRRLVTAIVISASALLAVTGTLALAWLTRPPSLDAPTGVLGAPTAAVLAASAGLLILLVLGIAGLEITATIPLVRSATRSDARAPDLATGSARVTVIIPAHDEAQRLPGTIDALRLQTHPADRIVVVADNCTDETPGIAHAAGLTVITTRDNRGRKAGALNQALARLLPATTPRDLLLVMDADTRICPEFIEVAVHHMESDGDVAAVGGIFMGEPIPGVLPQLQRNEFVRYSRQIRARKGRVSVLTGTATLFRASVLEEVAEERGQVLPGTRGKVYDERAITEDNELTLAVKALGHHVTSPDQCEVTTELMPSLTSLWAQRLRWQRGALENLSEYGFGAATARYWCQQWGIAYGSVALATSLLALIAVPVLLDSWTILPFWMLVTAAFSLERGITAWQAGWKGRLLAFSLLPEICYNLFLQACFMRAVMGLPQSRDVEWGHLRPQLVPEAT